MLQITPTQYRTGHHSETYRPDIDGLRCIAVLLVVGFHAFPTASALRFGFIGVDIFFVISGYLITSMILRDDFRISRFYARRIKRIFPALAVILVVTFAAGWLILSPNEFASLGANIAGGAAFSSNFVLLHQTGYFDIAAADKPLLHLWSLGIEEQFYICWPILLMFVVKRGFNPFVIATVIFVISFALNVAGIRSHPDLTFYSPLSRSWELAVGALLAVISFKDNPQRFEAVAQRLAPTRLSVFDRVFHSNQRWMFAPCDIRAVSGLLLLVIAVSFLHRDTPYPGWAALLPTFGAFLIISADGAWFNRHVLSARWAVFVGLISYPLYLWHWPLLAFARIVGEEQPNKIVQCFLIVISLVLAWLTYVLVERPIRFGNARSSVLPLCVAMLSIGVLGLFTVKSTGFPFRLPKDLRSQMDYSRLDFDSLTGGDYRHGRCLLAPDQDQTAFRAECNDISRRPLVFLWGDSHAASIYPGLRDLSKSIPFGLSQFTASGCPPFLLHVQLSRIYCKGINDYVFEQIKRTQPDIVILNATWQNDQDGTFDYTKFDYTMTELKRIGIKRIIVLGPLVRWGVHGLPNNVIDYYYKDAHHSLMPDRTDLRAYGADLDGQVRQKAREDDIEYISVWDVFCNQEGCLARVGEKHKDLTAWDYAHLTVAGSDFLANAIKSRLFPELLPGTTTKSP
jgi:peptidoglycan/LPS O-acetylase OafA/YrhL